MIPMNLQILPFVNIIPFKLLMPVFGAGSDEHVYKANEVTHFFRFDNLATIDKAVFHIFGWLFKCPSSS